MRLGEGAAGRDSLPGQVRGWRDWRGQAAGTLPQSHLLGCVREPLSRLLTQLLLDQTCRLFH